jgi:phytoene synthase
MTPTLRRSYEFCEVLAKREAANFYPAFRLLPRPQRWAMCALYAFMRVTDDLTDGQQMPSDKRAALDNWRRQFAEMLNGAYVHPLHPALHHALESYGVPRKSLLDVLDGVEMDLSQHSYETFADLYRYCYRVASAVGLACIHIWGFTDERATGHAESAGIAFQLTNILRDLVEDAARGRVYLPREDLNRFNYGAEQLLGEVRDDRFAALMRFEVERARKYYDDAEPLSGYLAPAGRAVYQVMARTYRGLLDAIEERNYDVFSSRVRLSRWRKLRLVMQAMPARWGWV